MPDTQPLDLDATEALANKLLAACDVHDTNHTVDFKSFSCTCGWQGTSRNETSDHHIALFYAAAQLTAQEVRPAAEAFIATCAWVRGLEAERVDVHVVTPEDGVTLYGSRS